MGIEVDEKEKEGGRGRGKDRRRLTKKDRCKGEPVAVAVLCGRSEN